ncbi:MAG: hypothetical protein HYV63_05265 [Candidatus Schekmanbacteria bacterium]|nr:hypothetical protein [Candidatus Schekmanbacteria bacterium]
MTITAPPVRRRPSRIFSTLVAAALALVVQPAAHALTFDQTPSLRDIAQQAALAFRGAVTDVSFDAVDVAGAARPIPYARVTFRVEKGYVGAATGSTVVIRMVGGVLSDGTAMHVAGLPPYRVGERAIVFANDRIHPFFGTLYGGLGLRRLATAEDGTQAVLDATWRPLAAVPASAESNAAIDAVCYPDPADRSRCGAWVQPVAGLAGSLELQPVSVSPASLMGLDAFETTIAGYLTEKQSLNLSTATPAQTVTADDIQFRESYGETMTRIQQPVALISTATRAQ